MTLLAGVAALLAACSEPPPPRSVDEFLRNPIMLEAALVRCAQNRSATRYEAECVNAREANKQIAAREEAKRREEFEKQSERKRQALRRAQQAAATAEHHLAWRHKELRLWLPRSSRLRSSFHRVGDVSKIHMVATARVECSWIQT